jgi:hypothetical protein
MVGDLAKNGGIVKPEVKVSPPKIIKRSQTPFGHNDGKRPDSEFGAGLLTAYKYSERPGQREGK